ncbi:Protein VTS1 [Ceratocystis lukuohia]|uniref:RNA-binding protein VTS1 n=1 Tax=Ceratocystis lukuohia TaxID=2019550 RepID=A0ABR4M8C3_9PEZI
MLNMSSGQVTGNRNSTPEATSSLRPPAARSAAPTHLRASADMTGAAAPSPGNRIRPLSDFYGQSQGGSVPGQVNADGDSQDSASQQWIADIDQFETTLEEMAAATLDQDFKEELSAIEQWFRVLSEAERTAALYALLQQTTQVQIRFFIQVLQHMGKSHPMGSVLSPTAFEKDPMSNRLSDAMNKLSVEGSRNSIGRNASTTGKRQSGLDTSTINAMFPDAAAAIATEKAKFTQQTGNQPSSTLVNPVPAVDVIEASQNSPWNPTTSNDVTKTTLVQAPMGQFAQPPTAGLRSPLPSTLSSNTTIQSTTLTTGEKSVADLPLLSPYGAAGGNWASMVNTPLVANFGATPNNQADMVANATAMKLAALSTVNNRFALDDVRKYRRARSNDPGSSANQSLGPGLNGAGPPGMPQMPGANVVMINEHGQVLTHDQVMNIQAQQNAVLANQRSRPSSPGLPLAGFNGLPTAAFASPQHNGFLSARDMSSPLMGAISPMNMGSLSVPPEGYVSDHSDMARGRSPRGRRGTSKPPEDPTDPTLLQDIPSWLRSLRLHKYTDNLKDMKWQDLIELDDKALEERGVNALGARRKMLKVFEQVKEAKKEGKLP